MPALFPIILTATRRASGIAGAMFSEPGREKERKRPPANVKCGVVCGVGPTAKVKSERSRLPRHHATGDP
jgi:hypothetical protein